MFGFVVAGDHLDPVNRTSPSTLQPRDRDYMVSSANLKAGVLGVLLDFI